MNCPDKQLLEDLVDGELGKSRTSDFKEHIKSCSRCKEQLLQILNVYNALTETVDESPCPSPDTLEKYAKNLLSAEQIDEIQKHIDFCSRCDSYAWLFSASKEELVDWQKKEQLEYQKFQVENLGYNVAKETLEKLLPAKVDLLDNIWASVLSFVMDLKDKSMQQWPSFSSPVQLVGALGFSDMTDPESTATSIILATTLYVSQQIQDGNIEATPEKIKSAVQESAIKFGAGKELQKRLIETATNILLKSHT